MNPTDFLTDNGHAILLLCSALGLPKTQPPGAPAPFTLAEWNQLARRIEASPLQQPAGLFGRSPADLAEALGIPPADAERIAGLLERSSFASLEVESLFSRGIWAITRMDANYPAQLRTRLKHQAPTVLFGAGEITLLDQAGVAVVGSRQIDPAGIAFAEALGRKCAAAKVPVVSGAARGADRLAMTAALEAGGKAFGVLADSLESTLRNPDLRRRLLDGELVLLTPYLPTAGFSIGGAMGRNKIIYGLADFALVVSSDLEKGGTWAGAVEALKAGWCPVFARADPGVPPGNLELVKKGAVAIEQKGLDNAADLLSWLREHATARLEQPDLLPDL
jgi:predicted Rossmann fold nucleotide-binding protein DprA/Smf involved in DNA uptake